MAELKDISFEDTGHDEERGTYSDSDTSQEISDFVNDFDSNDEVYEIVENSEGSDLSVVSNDISNASRQ